MSKRDEIYDNIILEEDNLKKSNDITEDEQTSLLTPSAFGHNKYIICLVIGFSCFGFLLIIGFFTWIVVCGTLRGNNTNYTTNLCI